MSKRYEKVRQKLVDRVDRMSHITLEELIQLAQTDNIELSKTQHIKVYYSILDDMIMITIAFEYARTVIDRAFCIFDSVLSGEDYIELCTEATNKVIEKLQDLGLCPELSSIKPDTDGVEIDGVKAIIKINPLY